MVLKLKRSECSVLPLVLMGKWYDLIASGEKREEYRTSKNVIRQIERWVGHGYIMRKHLVVEFYLGYQRDRKHMAFLAELPVCREGAKHPEWGEPKERHYVIPILGEMVAIE